jgi:hypothetical protein
LLHLIAKGPSNVGNGLIDNGVVFDPCFAAGMGTTLFYGRQSMNHRLLRERKETA